MRYGNWSSVATWLNCAVGWLYTVDQVAPPLNDTVAPPSFPSIIRFESRGSIHRTWQSPCGTRMRENVRPPSTERHVPRFSTDMVFSSTGSAVTKEQYHGRIMNVCSAFTRSQLLPASSERQMPASQSGASTLAQRRDGLAGDTVTPRRPSGRRGRPSLAVMSLQGSPPSVLFPRPP